MSKLDVGDTVLVKGTVTHEGIQIGGRTVPADELDVLTDVPSLEQLPIPLILFFEDEVDRAKFAASFYGLPGIGSCNL